MHLVGYFYIILELYHNISWPLHGSLFYQANIIYFFLATLCRSCPLVGYVR